MRLPSPATYKGMAVLIGGLRTGISPVRGVLRCYLPVCLSVICELPTYQAINPTYLPVSFVYSLSYLLSFRFFAI